ncbi:MAG: hypothetical protein ACYSWQ_20880, partial [Planctomycetota bacterium]
KEESQEESKEENQEEKSQKEKDQKEKSQKEKSQEEKITWQFSQKPASHRELRRAAGKNRLVDKWKVLSFR